MIGSTLLLAALTGLTTLSSAAPTPYTTKRGASGKRGLAFGKGNADKTALFAGEASWGYNWEAQLLPGLASGVEYVPMLHDDQTVFTSGFAAFAKGLIEGGTSKHILSINEPDQTETGGACMDIGRTVNAHKAHIQPLADAYPDVKIGSPSVTNGGGEMGLTYLKNFLAACHGCRIDFVCPHWYNGGDIEAFKTYMRNFHTETGKPLWISEWAAPGGDVQFMKDAIKWMDETDFVYRYAYMSVDSTLTAGSALTALGAAYASA
ncbi:hypothetical protein BCR34DRAFT_640914 [Clohesyomyces aquaticus]|uniref:Asl1-like glycosyl hydrolase catalytic domain-containing protein n=1 Tax=Clohesyomyces aquaticus TaxID=1231657 RepID=A0A1Y1YK23_9PLEO|nr:hypothetical protein BCR34DRAFT_640914 [Clohesyomyces aquaticus]